MLNLKIGGIFAGIAFILSFILGLAGGTGMPLLIIRPVIFAGLFFVISGLIKLLVSRFLPEILEEDDFKEDSGNLPGSRINILEGDFPEGGLTPGPVSFGAIPDEADHGLENISDLLAKSTAARASSERTQAGMDQNPQEDYTGVGVLESISESAQDENHGKQAGKADAGVSGEEVLPDLDSMAGAFMSPVTGEEPDTAEYSVSAPSPKPSSGSKSKAPAWSGDFNAKDLASGLRTILSKEKEG